MMLKLLQLLFISLLFQACQVSEEVASAKQLAATTLFPGATLTTVLQPNGWKKLGDNIDVTLLFPLPITVTNSPYISAQIGASTRRLYYESGSGTKTLIFRYTVTSVDLDTGGITINPSITLNGGTLTYTSSPGVTANVPTGLSIPDRTIKVDGVVPYLNQVTAPAGGNYSTGQQLKYNMYFSEKVFVQGVPSFSVYMDSGTVAAKYKSGSGSTSLEFSRLLIGADADANGFSTGTILNLSAISGITVTDQAGNSISSTIYSTTSTNVLVNVVQPTIVSVTPPVGATYTLGQNLDFTVLMSEAVTVTGTPSIPITLNTGVVFAKYLSGSGTNTLIYRYTVQVNHVDSNGITLISPMQLNGGSITNIAVTNSAALLYTVPATPTVLVDAATGPYVLSTNPPNNATYLETQNLDFTVNFSSAVDITASPRLPIIIGTTTVYANYLSGTGTSAIIFRYTTTTSDSDMDGISLSGPIDLNGGTIEDVANKAAILAYVPPNTTGILVDGTSPTITSVLAAGSGNLIAGQHLNFAVQFSEAIVVNLTGVPSLSIVVDGNNYNASYYSGSGTSTLIFRYTLGPGDEDNNGIDMNTPLVLNAGTIRDLRNHDATLTFISGTTLSYIIDSQESTISSFVPPAAPPAAGYKMGDNLDFVVNWSEATYITGSPRLVLTVGTSTFYANYYGPGSTATSFIFRYTVGAGHLDTDGIVTTGLQLNGGLLKDAAGNNADYSFVIPSLAAYTIDGNVPYVTTLSVPGNNIYKAGQSLVFTLVWDQAIVVTGAPVLNLIIGSTTVNATYASINATTKTFTYTITSGELDTNGINLLSAVFLPGGATIKDLAGNDSYLQINPPDLSGVKVDAIVPTIIAVIAPDDGTYKLTETLDFEVLWSEPVTVNTTGGTPTIALTLDSGVVNASYYAAGSTPGKSIFRYTVANVDSDPTGVALGTSITLNGGTIQDAATNDAFPLTFAAPVTPGVLVDGVTATILSWTPPADATYPIGGNLDVTVHWSENVDIDTTGGTPYIVLFTNTYRYAYYVSGTGTQDIVFRYTVVSGESSSSTWLYGQVYPNGGTIKDAALNDAYVTFPPSASWINYPDVDVDGIRPTVSSSTSDNITSVANDDYFKPSNTIEYTLNFSESVTVTGSPRLVLDIGGATRYATYFAATSTATSKKFRLIMDAADVLLDLDGIDVNTAVDMNGGSIQDAVTNDFTATFTFSEKDYVYFTNMMARYHLSNSDYTTSTCAGSAQCITTLKDITGNGYNLTPTAIGPQVISGYGTNSTSYMQFNDLASLKFPNLAPNPNTAFQSFSIKYVILVMKNVSNASVTATLSSHTLLNRWDQTSTTTLHWGGGATGAHTHNDSIIYYNQYHYYNTYAFMSSIKYTSDDNDKSILMYPTQKIKINAGAFTPAYSLSETGPTLWTPSGNNIYIHEYSTPLSCWPGTLLGGSSFNGQVAEAIFFNSTATVSEANLERIRDQLNAIHGAY